MKTTHGRNRARSAIAPIIIVGVIAANKQYQIPTRSAGTLLFPTAGESPMFLSKTWSTFPMNQDPVLLKHNE